MQSVPMSSSLRSTSWLGPPPPFHMASYTHGKPPSKAKTLSHLTSCLLHPPFITESRALAVQTPVQALTHSTNMQPVVLPPKHSARPQDTAQASRATHSQAVRNRGVRHRKRIVNMSNQ